MANAMNEVKNEWNEAKKDFKNTDTAGYVDRAVSEVKKLNPEEIKKTATEFTSKVRDMSVDYYDDAVTYVRRNPVATAFGLCAVGFLVGALAGGAFKKKSV